MNIVTEVIFPVTDELFCFFSEKYNSIHKNEIQSNGFFSSMC